MKRSLPLGFETLDDRVLPALGSLNILAQLFGGGQSSNHTGNDANSPTVGNATSSNDVRISDLLNAVTSALKDLIPDLEGDSTNNPSANGKSDSSAVVPVVTQPVLPAESTALTSSSSPLGAGDPPLNYSSTASIDQLFEQIMTKSTGSNSNASSSSTSSIGFPTYAASSNGSSNNVWGSSQNSSSSWNINSWLNGSDAKDVIDGLKHLGTMIQAWVNQLADNLSNGRPGGNGSSGGNPGGGVVVTTPPPLTTPSNPGSSTSPSQQPNMDSGHEDGVAVTPAPSDDDDDSTNARESRVERGSLIAIVRDAAETSMVPGNASTPVPRDQGPSEHSPEGEANSRARNADEWVASEGASGTESPADDGSLPPGNEDSAMNELTQAACGLSANPSAGEENSLIPPQIEEMLASVSLPMLLADVRIDFPEFSDFVETMDEGFQGWVKEHQIGLSLLAGAGAFWLAQMRAQASKSSRARWLSLVAGHDEVFANMAIEE